MTIGEFIDSCMNAHFNVVVFETNFLHDLTLLYRGSSSGCYFRRRTFSSFEFKAISDFPTIIFYCDEVE